MMNKTTKLNLTGLSDDTNYLETMKPQRKTFLKGIIKLDLMKIVKVLSKEIKGISYILPIILLLKFSVFTSGHSDTGTGDALDTGSNLSSLSIVFVGFGIGMFILILLSGIWLLRR